MNAAGALAVVAFASLTLAQDPLARARQAVGGNARVQAVTSLSLIGSGAAASLATGELRADRNQVEIRLAFPDKYLRIMNSDVVRRRVGFVGSTPVSETQAVQGSSSSSPPGPAFVAMLRSSVARLLIGMLGDTRGVLKIETAPIAGKPGSFTVSGPDGVLGVLDVDASGLPLRFHYEDAVPTVDRSQPGRVVGGFKNGPVTMSFEDRRLVNGLKLPHRIRRTSEGRLVDELTFDKIVLNPRWQVADFK